MKKLRTLLTLLALVVAGTAIVSLSGAASAATSGNGMRVEPVVTPNIVIKPGESHTVHIYVTNVTDAKTTYKVIHDDFIAADNETGAPALLLNGESNDRHGLKRYMHSVDEVTVPAGEKQKVDVKINIPKGTAGGGYYGAVRFAPISGSDNDSGTTEVSLSGSVGALVLVRVPGDVMDKLSLVSFDARKDSAPKVLFTSNDGIMATARIRNDGNVQEQPFGKILLKKGGETIGTYEINTSTPPGNVLPDSIRRFEVPLKDVGNFGKYTIVGNFGYGDNGQLLSGKSTFYVVPLWMILIGVLIVLFILFLIFGLPKLVRNYNRRVIRKASRKR